jgi:replication-associated recombination protein RarA
MNIKKEKRKKRDRKRYFQEMKTWLDKHVPTSLNDFICYQHEMQQIRQWIQQFKINPSSTKKVLFLIGSSGIGKTKMCEVLLQEYDYRVMEYNSSELRSQKRITEVLEKSLTYRNVFEMMEEENKPIGILIDEIEGLIGTGDKGGFTEFLDILKSNMKYEEYEIKP